MSSISKTAMAAMFILLSNQASALADASLHTPAGAPPPAGDILGLSGSVRGAWWSVTPETPDKKETASTQVWLKSAPQTPWDSVTIRLDGWARNDSANDGKAKGELREAYIGFSHGAVELTAGRMIEAWGKADALNPTDNLVARDYTLPAPDDSSQKSGVGAVKATWDNGSLRVTGLWLPEFRANRLPLPKDAPPITEVKPENEQNQWAARMEYFGNGYDWSVSYFDGLDRTPDVALEGSAVQFRHGRIQAYGADAAVNVGAVALRAEAAYIQTQDKNGDDPFIKNSVTYVVAGGDRTFYEDYNVNLQVVHRHVADYRKPETYPAAIASLVAAQAFVSNQFVESETGFTARVGGKWLHDTLRAEVAALVWATKGDSLLRPKVTYDALDNLKVSIGGVIYQGPEDSLFGGMKDYSGGYMEVQMGF